MVAEVIINSTAKKLNRTFDYNIPKELENIATSLYKETGKKFDKEKIIKNFIKSLENVI